MKKSMTTEQKAQIDHLLNTVVSKPDAEEIRATYLNEDEPLDVNAANGLIAMLRAMRPEDEQDPCVETIEATPNSAPSPNPENAQPVDELIAPLSELDYFQQLQVKELLEWGRNFTQAIDDTAR